MNKALIIVGLVAIAVSGCADMPRNEVDEPQWIALFDGSNVDAWREIHSDDFPQTCWVVDDGMLVFEPGKNCPGDIITRQEYSNFILEMEFKMTKAANSGIKYFVVEELNKGRAGLGLEYQILDDANHPDAANGRDGNRTLASLYDLKAASSDKPVKPIGEWNMVRIVSDGKHVEHWLNGVKVLEFERGGKEYMDLLARSKYKKMQDFGLAETGHILLQNHNDKVSFRDIRIQVLDKKM